MLFLHKIQEQTKSRTLIIRIPIGFWGSSPFPPTYRPPVELHFQGRPFSTWTEWDSTSTILSWVRPRTRTPGVRRTWNRKRRRRRLGRTVSGARALRPGRQRPGTRTAWCRTRTRTGTARSRSRSGLARRARGSARPGLRRTAGGRPIPRTPGARASGCIAWAWPESRARRTALCWPSVPRPSRAPTRPRTCLRARESIQTGENCIKCRGEGEKRRIKSAG